MNLWIDDKATADCNNQPHTNSSVCSCQQPPGDVSCYIHLWLNDSNGSYVDTVSISPVFHTSESPPRSDFVLAWVMAVSTFGKQQSHSGVCRITAQMIILMSVLLHDMTSEVYRRDKCTRQKSVADADIQHAHPFSAVLAEKWADDM